MSRAERAISILTLLAVALFTLYDRGGEWRGEWDWSIAYAMGTTVLTGPVVAAIAAWLGWNRHGLRAATDSAPRGWLVALRHGAAAWFLGLTALVGATAVAIGATLLVPHGGRSTRWRSQKRRSCSPRMRRWARWQAFLSLIR